MNVTEKERVFARERGGKRTKRERERVCEREGERVREREKVGEREREKGRREREKEGHNKENYIMMNNRRGEELDSASRELRKIEKR